MSTYLKKIFRISGLTALLFMFPLFSAHAQLPLGFGGFNTLSVPCTCNGGIITWRLFTPLYLGAAKMVAGAMITNAAAVGFPYYNLHILQWELGIYEPLGDAPICYVGVEPYCYPLSAYGYVTPYTGVSR